MALIFFFLCAVQAATGASLPAIPTTHVVDEAQSLTPQVVQAVDELLGEHDRLTGEQILYAVFPSLDGEDLVERTSSVFSHWKPGQIGKHNGILVAIYWADRKVRIEVGYGLEGVLTDAKSKSIIEDVLVPRLKDDDPNGGVIATVVTILEILESPLAREGKIDEILRGVARPISRDARGRHQMKAPLWVIVLGFGIALFLGVFFNALAAEAHYTSGGWYHPRPGGRLRRRLSGGGFGFPIGGGGGGGFMGGGGRSGGGGASGSW